MKIKNISSFAVFLVAFILGMVIMKFYQNNTTETPHEGFTEKLENEPQLLEVADDISALTAEDLVIAYLKQHQKLPDFYLTKSAARKKGWSPNQGNLCDVLPGYAIGGDYFGNRENKLPKKNGRKYFEADVNYDCGRRNADRIVYSNDGLIYLTKDHYKSFHKQ